MGQKKVTGIVAFLAALATIAALAVTLSQSRNDLRTARERARGQETVQALLVEQRDLMATAAVADSDSLFWQMTQSALNEKLFALAPDLPTAPLIQIEPTSTSLPPTLVSEPSQVSSSVPTEQIVELSEVIVLANNVDNVYTWDEGSPYLTTKYVYEGDVAFIPTGNNHFTKRAGLGIVGFEPEEVRYISFQLYLLQAEAALLLQVQTPNGSWNHRWGFDGRPSFNGYGWPREGQYVNHPTEEWIDIKLDLINELGINPGDQIIGLAFSSRDGSVVYDRVVLLSSED